MRIVNIECGIAAAFAVLIAIASPPAGAQQAATPAVAIDNDDIGGVVRGPGGPEAGVWVIAETRDLPVRYIKIVVTDDQGRYVIPDLPKANYDVWVRGYGLVDLPKVKSEPGKQLNLTAVPAPSETAAAQYYPAIYWYSMMKVPAAGQFGAKGDMPPNVKLTRLSQRHEEQRLRRLPSARPAVDPHHSEVPPRTSKSHEEAWMRRIQSGQAGENMVTLAAGELGGAPFKYFGDWTERVAKGELPDAKPTRPQGVERNIVVTLRDWHNGKQYLHDLIASDRRYPTVNAYGPVYGQCEHACDDMPILDPVKNVATNFVLPTHARHAAGARARQCRLDQDPADPRPIGARRTSGTAGPTTTTRCSTGRAACGWRRPGTSRTIRTSARRARTIRRRWSSRSTAPTAG